MVIKSRWLIGLGALGAIWMSVHGCQCSVTRAWFDTPGAVAVSDPAARLFGHAETKAGHHWRREAAGELPPSGVEPSLLGDPVGPVSGERVLLEPIVAHPWLLAGRRQRTFLKIGLTGFDMNAAERLPANVSIVLDRSGSMAGAKLDRAKEAAAMVIERLRADDVVSVVAYDSSVDVLVPATGAIEPQALIAGIQRYSAGTNTALYDGVSAGAAEVRKNLDRQRINRVVLLSDGQANVGPSSAEELGELGAKLGAEGIAVTTIGLGLAYNTGLMTGLATRSEGNHFFARSAQDLAEGFGLEFGAGLAVVARDAGVQVRFAEGFRPLGVLNAKAKIQGRTVSAHLPQLYANHKAYLLLEVEALPDRAGKRVEMAAITLRYENLKTGVADRLSRRLEVTFTDSQSLMQAHEQAEVMEAVAIIEAARRSQEAIRLRQQGDVSAARREFDESAAVLKQKSRRYRSDALEDLAKLHQASANRIQDDQEFKSDVCLYGHKNMRDFGARSRPY